MECSKCGGGGKLFDVISGEGIVKICENCLSSESVPIIRKPTQMQIESINKDKSLYNRLSESAGLNASEHRKNIFGSEQQEKLKEQDRTLRELVDKKFDKFVKQKLEKRDDLIDNFHWVIMRTRRNKKMTVRQLAEEIGESENVIKMAEQGVLPSGDYRIVQRLESVLGINILKPDVAEQLERTRKQLGFDEFSSRDLTISDLHEMKREPVKSNKEPYWRRIMLKLLKKENPEMAVDFVEIASEMVPKAPEAEVEEGQKEGVEKESANPRSDLNEEVLEFEKVKEVEIEFNDTSLEMDDVIGPKSEIEEKSNEEKSNYKEDLSNDEIDDLIYGRK